MANMLSRVKNAIAKFNNLSRPQKLLILLVVAIIIVVVLVALDVIPKETVFPSSISQVSHPIPEIEPKPEIEPEPEPFEPEPLVYIGSGGCVGGKQEIPEGHCDENPECTAIGRQHNGCWHMLKGDVPDEAVLAKYKWGLFKKTDAGYEAF